VKNVIVGNFNDNKTNSVKVYQKDRLIKDMSVQIENSLELGWNRRDIWVITNFPFVHKGIGSIQFILNEDCLTGSKMFAMRELFRHGMVNDIIWIHDLDVWQNTSFNLPCDLKKCGICEYSRAKFNGGSMFFQNSAKEIVDTICQHLEENHQAREEPTLDLFFKGQLKNEITILNYTFNVGCSGFVKRWGRATKPISAVHFHPTNRIAWDTMTRDRNGVGEPCVSGRLKDLFIRHYEEDIKLYNYDDKKSPFEVRDKAVSEERAERTKSMLKDINKLIDIDDDLCEDVETSYREPEKENKIEDVPGNNYEKLKNIDLIDAFRELLLTSGASVRSISKFIYEKVGLRLNVGKLNINDKKVRNCWGGVKMTQYPDEMAKLLYFIFVNKDFIKSYLEIGVDRGGSFFVIDSFLRAIYPEGVRSLAIDVKDKIIRKSGFAEYANGKSEIEFKMIDSGKLNLEEKFDLCFIDGDHSYEGVKRDWECVKDHVKIILFHDVAFKRCGVPKFWDEVSKLYERNFLFCNENLNEFPVSLGIGGVTNDPNIIF